MFVRRFGLQPAFAPENDQGSDPALDTEDDLDLDLDADPDDPETDDPDEGDDGDSDAEDEQDDPAPQPTRGENRVAVATRTAKEAKDRAEALEREVAALRQQVSSPPAARETPEQRHARLSAMEPWERTEALRQESEAATNARLQRMEFDNWDARDKLAYDALASRLPIAAKLKDEVEKRVQTERAAGRVVDREAVLKFFIGERTIANAGRASGRAQRSATANRERQTVRPANGRADVAPAGRRGSEAAQRDRRLEDMEI